MEYLAAARPRTRRARGRRAAVAAILAPDDDGAPALLFIRRARRAGDRWSGHVAFPGGLRSRADLDDAATARREAAEEVGITLPPPFQHLDDVVTGRPGSLRPMRVRPFLFALDHRPAPTPDPAEVAEVFWVPLRDLHNTPRSRMWRKVLGLPYPFSRVLLGERTLWGLTLMMVDDLLRKARARR